MARPVFNLVLMLIAAMAAIVFSTNAEAACGAGTAGRTERIEIGGRSLLLHRPVGGEQALPLVVLLHGSTMTGAVMLADTTLEATADRHGFVVVAPDAAIPARAGFAWNIPGVPTVTGVIPGPDAADDVVWIGAIVDDLVQQGCVDPGRVYATGLSGGGRMASWLGCVEAERFAAIAPVVGLRAGNPDPDDPARPAPATCRPDAPMPVIAFAGDADPVNPTQGGGAGYWSYTMHAAEQRWAQLNGCTAAPVTAWVADGVYEERYGDCEGDAEVVGRVTVGGGHEWQVDEDAMWAFFAAHSRSAH